MRNCPVANYALFLNHSKKGWKVWPLLCEDISQYSEHPGCWHFDKSCQRLSLLTSTNFASLLSSSSCSSSSWSSSSLLRPSRSSFPPSGSWNSELSWLCVFCVEAREAGCMEPSSSESWCFINQSKNLLLILIVLALVKSSSSIKHHDAISFRTPILLNVVV